MKLIAYTTSARPCPIQPANSKREWMDDASAKNPYRCLPLSMANSWGWEILSNAKFTATWDGGKGSNAVKVVVHAGTEAPSSHFGEGTLTWHSGYIFKTPYPYGLYVTGAPNYPKPNVIPLSGVVETNWLAYTFTMNWRFTQPGSFTMDIGEPFCQIFPVDMNTFDNVTPEIRTLHTDDKEFHDLYWDWNVSRANYMNLRRTPGTPESVSGVWQKHYFQGLYPAGEVNAKPTKCPFHNTDDGKTESAHGTKPNVPAFVDMQTEPYRTLPEYTERTRETKQKHDEYLKSVRQQQDALKQSILNAPKVGPRIERTPEEVEERMRYYESILRAQAEELNKKKRKLTKTITIGINNDTSDGSHNRSTARSSRTNSGKQRTAKGSKTKNVSTNRRSKSTVDANS